MDEQDEVNQATIWLRSEYEKYMLGKSRKAQVWLSGKDTLERTPLVEHAWQAGGPCRTSPQYQQPPGDEWSDPCGKS